MAARSSLSLPVFMMFGVAFTAACGDDSTAPIDTAVDVDTAEAGDTVILPDTVPTEVEVIIDVAPEVVVPGQFGAPCTTNANCDSGYCVDGPKGYVCTRTCDTTCPEGYDCKSVTSDTDVVFLCIPRTRSNCTPCAQNFQCQGGLCMDIDGEGRCAYECETQEDCPEGFTCDETTQAAGLFCQPSTGSCSCYADVDGGLRSCTTPSALGVCTGISECDQESGWSACSATQPTVEVCNGRDDDCNGVWDDNLEGAGGPCQNTVEGVGSCTGVKICLGIAGWLCVGASPSVETCNGLDDDCDGVADDPFKNEQGAYVSEEHCGGCGVACAGKIPNAVAFCAGAGATPRCEVASCEPGYYKAGPLTCLPVEDYSCVPCLTDAQCTTPGSQCLPLDGGKFCGRDCAAGNTHGTPAGQCPDGYTCEDYSATEGAGVRQCVPTSRSCTCLGGDAGEQRPCTRQSEGGTCFGTQTCAPATGWTACSATVPAAETCNNLDDNCNAAIDDVIGRFEACNITNSFGTCAGVRDCRPGSPSLTCVGTTPAAEICNGRDDDCNGETDNINGPLCAKQVGVCAGSRQICAGQLGFLACNIGSYGVNYEVNETKCDGLDNDCDGKTDEVDLDGDGHKPLACGGQDCDDTDRLSYPGAVELCGDFADNDCNGVVDDRDGDGDGWVAVQCGGEDCNDESDVASPGGIEVCNDNYDNDCDGSVNNKDVDRDGFLDYLCGGSDCDDGNFRVKPGAPEVCDGLDNNCNGRIDDKDSDADGYIDTLCGGIDCDDTRPLINPDGIEVCGNAFDEDCSGALDDRDIDKDGALATQCGGNDCDDYDPQTKLGAPEVWDTRDNDCDGHIDEGVVPAGAIIVTEVLVNTITAGSEEPEEYFEVTNVAGFPIDLKRWTFWDCGSQASSCTSADANSDTFTVSTSLVVSPGKPVVFCVNADSTFNGGLPCDYEYGGGMALGNTGDEIIVSFGGAVMSRTNWPTEASFAGQARILKPDRYRATETDIVANWCRLTSPQIGTSGNFGTPGKINPGDCANTPPPGAALALPSNGLGLGGERVTIFGSGFLNGNTSVAIGGSICGNVSVLDANVLTCTTSLHVQGAGAVVVTVNSVASASLTNGYTYTTSGAGPFTSGVMVAAAPYTMPAGLAGPIITGRFEPGALASVRAEVGFGPNNSDPAVTPGWRWVPAIRISSSPTVDLFTRSLVIDSAGSYAYAYRASVDGITWLYTPISSAVITP